jgi:hypothetical protein
MHPLVRKAMCELAEPIRCRRLMDEGGILIVNFARGPIGGDIVNVLGGLIVSSITNAACGSRARWKSIGDTSCSMWTSSIP